MVQLLDNFSGVGGVGVRDDDDVHDEQHSGELPNRKREREAEGFGARVFVYSVGVTLSSSWRYWMLDTAAREAWMAARSPCSHCSER